MQSKKLQVYLKFIFPLFFTSELFDCITESMAGLVEVIFFYLKFCQ